MGKQPIKRLDECVCATDSLCYITETNTVDQPNSNNLFLNPEGKKFWNTANIFFKKKRERERGTLQITETEVKQMQCVEVDYSEQGNC